MSRPVVVSPVKAILAILVLRQRLARLDAEPVDDIDDALGQQIAEDLHKNEDAERGLLGGLDDDAISGGQGRGELPNRHQHREVPGDDLANYAQRLMEVIGDGVVVDLRDRPFLRAQRAGEVAPVVDAQGNVGEGRLSDRLAVVERFDERQQLGLRLHTVGYFVEEARALSGRGLAPGVLCLVSGVEREFDVGGGRAGDFAQLAAGDRARIVEILTFDRRDELAADEVIVAWLDENLLGNRVQSLLEHGYPPSLRPLKAVSFAPCAARTRGMLYTVEYSGKSMFERDAAAGGSQLDRIVAGHVELQGHDARISEIWQRVQVASAGLDLTDTSLQQLTHSRRADAAVGACNQNRFIR